MSQQLYHQKGDTEAAIKDYTSALELESRMPQILANRGGLWAKKGDRKRAAKDYQKALSVAPDDWPFKNKVEAALRALQD